MNKTRNGLTLILLAALTMLSCSRNSVSLPTWLEGTWETGDTIGLVAESWEVINEEFMSGEGLFVNNEKQNIVEILSIFVQNNALVYAAMLPNQNKGEEIIFIDSSNNPDSLVFVNSSHDYPKKIIYHHNAQRQVDVYLYGSSHDKVKHISLKRNTE